MVGKALGDFLPDAGFSEKAGHLGDAAQDGVHGIKPGVQEPYLLVGIPRCAKPEEEAPFPDSS